MNETQARRVVSTITSRAAELLPLEALEQLINEAATASLPQTLDEYNEEQRQRERVEGDLERRYFRLLRAVLDSKKFTDEEFAELRKRSEQQTEPNPLACLPNVGRFEDYKHTV